MLIYSNTGATEINEPGYAPFTADANGGFNLPDDLAIKLLRFHANGQPMWETPIDRETRLVNAEAERRRDPASLLAAVEEIIKAGALAAAANATQVAPMEPEKPKRGRAAASTRA